MSMRIALRVDLASLLLTIFGQALYAQNYDRWVYLGEANVDGRADHDRIKIGRDNGRFRALQIRDEQPHCVRYEPAHSRRLLSDQGKHDADIQGFWILSEWALESGASRDLLHST